MATINALADVIQAQAAVPPSGITAVVKKTEKMKVVWSVGTGELAQS
jgi:hypothetical protein